LSRYVTLPDFRACLVRNSAARIFSFFLPHSERMRMNCPVVDNLSGLLTSVLLFPCVEPSNEKGRPSLSGLLRKERLAAKRQEDLATALSVTVKVIKMLSAVRQIRSEINAGHERLAARRQGNADLWQVVAPFGTMPPPVLFTSKESAFILSTKDRDVMLTTIGLAEVHNDLPKLVASYSERREALTSSFPVTQVNGNYVAHDFSPEETRKHMPRVIQLRSLTGAMILRSEKDYSDALSVFNHLKAYCVGRFGEDFPPLEIVPEASGRSANA